MIVKGREIIPPLNYFPYSFLFPLFSYYSYSSFFFLPFRTRPPHLRSPSSFPLISSSSLFLFILAPVVISLHLPISLCPSLHPAFSYSPISSHLLIFRSHPVLPYTLPFLTLQSHLTSLFFDLTPFFLTLRFHLTSLLSDLLSTYICSPTSDLTPSLPTF